MAKQILAFVLICVSGLTLGCYAEQQRIGQADQLQVETDLEIKQNARPPQRELQERDFEIIRFVLSQADDSATADSSGQRIYFLTTTPREYWGTRGQWETLPESFHATLDSLRPKYRPAEQACLRGGYVIENETDVRSTMVWVTVKKWISPTEVEVEAGSWGGPLDALGSTKIYEKQDGQWKTKTVLNSWLS